VSNHPDRKALMKAARKGVTKFRDHLESCEECSLLYNLWRALPSDEILELPHVPQAWIEQAAGFMSKSKKTSVLKRLEASLVFDSWSSIPAIEIRDGQTNVRRLGFDVGQRRLDIQASRRNSDWQFVARFEDEQEGIKALLKVSSDRSVLADDDGYFIWNAKTPPRRLSIELNDELYEIKDIKWNPTKKRSN